MFRDIVISLLSQLDVIGGAVIALNYGFLMLPSAIGYLAGALGSWFTGSVTPVSFMYESMVLSYGLSKNFRERISMILLAALLTGILGIVGLPQMIVDSIGKDIFLAMLAGVGLYLAKVGIDIVRDNPAVGIPCFIAAVTTQVVTNDLILTVAISVPLGFVINWFKKRGVPKKTEYKIPKYKSFDEMLKKEFVPVKPVLNYKVLMGALALSVLTIGGNVAYVGATLDLTKAAPTYNQATLISSVADFASSVFGGANMELIISPTASADNPLRAAILYMIIAAVILISGLIYKIAKWIPMAAMGGYLFVIGAILILPYNAIDAFKTGDPLVVGLTLAVTLLVNPFYGMAAGVLTKYILIL